MVNSFRLGLLGNPRALLMIQSTLIAIGLQTIVIAQETSRPQITSTNQKQSRQLDKLDYPGEESRNALLNAAKNLESIIKSKPLQAANYVALADVNTMLWCFGFVARDEVLPRVKAAALKAVELDGKIAAAHTALGIAKLAEWDWEGAEKELKLAVHLEPNRAQSRHWYALYLTAMGRHQEALKQSEQAVKLDPSPGTATGLGAILYFSRDWSRMIDHMSATTKQSPEFAPAYDWLGMAYVQEHKFEQSISTYEKAVELSGGLAEILAGLGHAYGMAGQQQKAREVLQKMHAMDKLWYIPPVQIAYVHVGLGEVDEACQLLERAYQQRSWELVFLQVEPWFDDIRDEPRFIELIEKIKFPKQK